MKKKAKKITMEDLAGMVQRGFLETAKKADVVAIKKDVVILKNGVSLIKSEVGSLKEDVSILKADVYTLKEDVKAIKEDVADLKDKFHKVLGALDKVAKQYADYMEERKMRDAEIARIKRWVGQIAQKVGVELVD